MISRFQKEYILLVIGNPLLTQVSTGSFLKKLFERNIEFSEKESLSCLYFLLKQLCLLSVSLLQQWNAMEVGRLLELLRFGFKGFPSKGGVSYPNSRAEGSKIV